MKYKEICLNDIFEFPSINSGITEKFIREHPGNIPVYGSRKDGKAIGYIKDNLIDKKYFSNCLSWNRNGSVGYTFYRDHKFMTTDDCRPLILKKEFEKELDYNFLRFAVQNVIFANGFAWGDKAGKEKLQLLHISIPIKNTKFDLEKQISISQKYNKIEKIKKNINTYYTLIKKNNIKINNVCSKTSDFEISYLFEIYKGNAKYTKKYFINNKGNYNVYSGATLNNGLVAQINTYDWDIQAEEKVLTWTTDGIYAGTVFVRDDKFSLTSHCGLLKIKKSFKNLDINYLAYILNLLLPNYAVGEQNKRVTVKIIENVVVPIPVKANGDFDLEMQNKISRQYLHLKNQKQNIANMLELIEKSQIKAELDLDQNSI